MRLGDTWLLLICFMSDMNDLAMDTGQSALTIMITSWDAAAAAAAVLEGLDIIVMSVIVKTV